MCILCCIENIKHQHCSGCIHNAMLMLSIDTFFGRVGSVCIMKLPTYTITQPTQTDSRAAYKKLENTYPAVTHTLAFNDAQVVRTDPTEPTRHVVVFLHILSICYN
jgi:hypothetical protein